MGTGFLQVLAVAADGAMPVAGANVTVYNESGTLFRVKTDVSGVAETVSLEAPARELTLDPNFDGIPYSEYDVKVEATGYATAIVHDVEILDGETSILPVNLLPSLEDGRVAEYNTPPHNLVSNDTRHMDNPGEFRPPTNKVLSEVIIPEFITVHLGRPDNPNARNVRVPFSYYIKNSASHEIFSTWPAASLEANIYCIISLTLNRIFTEWYRVRGHNFDITNSTQFDQMFVENGQIFGTIDRMVDQIFNRFIRREGHVEPFFAEYCDGRRVTCPGLWQWRTVDLANQGRNALQILRTFYPNDIQIVETNNIGSVPSSFPGQTLRPGSSGADVTRLQNWLNRIRVNFPAIPQIPVTGVYDATTEAAVRAFQSIRTLGNTPVTGLVDRATWNNISRAYSAVKRLGELTSEGIVAGIGRTPPTDIIRQGSRGSLVGRAQYIMNFISEFYHAIPFVAQDSNFGPNFAAAVREFQRLFGLNPDGIIGPLTWRRMYEVYWRIRDNAKPPPEPSVPPVTPPGGIPPFPGTSIRVGARGDDVARIQRCLNQVMGAGLATDGAFGPLTQAAVINFQRSRGLNPDGIVGPITWGTLMPACYGGNSTMGEYPGTLIRVGARGDHVRQIQTCLNRTINAGLTTDGAFGPLTQAAVINYQRANGLNPDGIVGPLTWNNLRNRCGGATSRSIPTPPPITPPLPTPPIPPSEPQLPYQPHNKPEHKHHKLELEIDILEPIHPVHEQNCQPCTSELQPTTEEAIPVFKHQKHNHHHHGRMNNFLAYYLLSRMRRR
ncbi:MAG: peptidoglycan-binding protein [Defluviitaleaceae bacterium]|nr:peptidoglycan-binding protein [Defluviitaleaceae bacterium]